MSAPEAAPCFRIRLLVAFLIDISLDIPHDGRMNVHEMLGFKLASAENKFIAIGQ